MHTAFSHCRCSVNDVVQPRPRTGKMSDSFYGRKVSSFSEGSSYIERLEIYIYALCMSPSFKNMSYAAMITINLFYVIVSK